MEGDSKNPPSFFPPTTDIQKKNIFMGQNKKNIFPKKSPLFVYHFFCQIK